MKRLRKRGEKRPRFLNVTGSLIFEVSWNLGRLNLGSFIDCM
jgi:hypothetical protein